MTKAIPHFIYSDDGEDGDSLRRLFVYETLVPADRVAFLVAKGTRTEYETMETYLPKVNIPHLITYLSQFVEEGDGK